MRVLIIGQGMAGSTLAITLINRGHSVKVYDPNLENTCSKIAAGLINPITGRKPVLTWEADLIFPFAFKFYKELESRFSAKILHALTLLRSFPEGLVTETKLEPYINQKENSFPFWLKGFNATALNWSGWLDCALYLKLVQDFLIENNSFEQGIVNESELEMHEDKVIYQGETFDYVIKSTGFKDIISENSVTPGLNPVKGEILTMELDENKAHELEEIISKGIFILPISKTQVRIGSVYTWHQLDDIPTVSGKALILSQLAPLLTEGQILTLKDHLANVRPASKDRRPIIGPIDNQPRIWAFNGLGAKGVTLAPYFSQYTIEALESSRIVEKAFSTTRF